MQGIKVGIAGGFVAHVPTEPTPEKEGAVADDVPQATPLPEGPWLRDDAHDQRLIREVAPVDHPTPKPAASYHLVVLGGGSAGLVTAAAAAGLGARVALVEKTGLGGDCLLSGCVPSKALLSSAKRAHAVRNAAQYGIQVAKGTRVDFPAVMQRMRRIRADLSPVDAVKRFTELGIDVFQGHGRFVGPDTLQVGRNTLKFRSAVLATGGRAIVPPTLGLEEAGYLTHETVFNLDERPKTMLVLGAGPIGCELSQAFSRLGTKVLLVDQGEHLLPRVAADAAALVRKSLEADGVRVMMGASLLRVLKAEAGYHCMMRNDAAAVEVDCILIATGRAPVVDNLGLDTAGVAFDRTRGVQVDSSLRTTNPRIYAAGDCANQERFTHVADATARVVVRNALFPGSKPAKLVIPTCTYTDPEVATVGRTAKDLVRDDIPHQAIQVDFRHVDRARLEGQSGGFARVLVHDRSDQILGAIVVGEGAGDLIGTLSLAITHNIGLGKFSSTIFPYPTRAEVLRKLGDAWQRAKLTPTAAKALGTWFKLHS